MANMSDYLENKLIDALFRGGSFTFPSTVYIGLCTASPNDASTGSSCNEVSGGNYARQSVACNSSNFQDTAGGTAATSSGTTGTTKNVSAISWSGVTWAATVTSLVICDAASGGNILFYGDLASSKTVSSGDTFTLTAAGVSVQIDN